MTFYFTDDRFREFMQDIVDNNVTTPLCVAVLLKRLFEVDSSLKDCVFVDEEEVELKCVKGCLCERSREISELDVLSNPYHPFYGESEIR